MNTCHFVHAFVGVAACLLFATAAGCSKTTESEHATSSAQTVARDGFDAGPDACPVTSVQIACGLTCAGTGPVRPLLETLMQCQGCAGGITRDGECLNRFLDACEPLGDPCIAFVNCVTDTCQ